MLKVFFVTVSLLFASLEANIRESTEISIVQEYDTSDSVVFFNVSGTLYAPSLTLADNQWRIYFSEKVREFISDPVEADALINKIKNKIVSELPKKPVEEATAPLIKEMQKQGVTVLGITQKQPSTPYANNFDFITYNHLLSIGVDFEKTSVHLKNPIDNLRYGILFTSKQPIGPSIVAFLDSLENKPSKVIVIDNSLKCLESAEQSLNEAGIQFEGIRYSGADFMIQAFDPVIGIIQFLEFMEGNEIPTDEEAHEIKELHSDIDYEVLLVNKILY